MKEVYWDEEVFDELDAVDREHEVQAGGGCALTLARMGMYLEAYGGSSILRLRPACVGIQMSYLYCMCYCR